MRLAPEQRRLFVETGHHIARLMWQTLGNSDPSYRTVMFDKAMSVYEHGCSLLKDFGIVVPEGPHKWRFVMPLDQVREYLDKLQPGTAYTLEQMIGLFLSASIDRRGELSSEKGPFQVPGHLQQAMWAFVQLDYAKREPTGFQWTEKVRPMMVVEGLWSHEGESLATLDKRQTLQLADEMWAALPLWRRHLLARWIVGKSELELFAYLFRRWNGARFTLFASHRGKFRLPPQGATDAAREILQRLLQIRQRHPF